jgi:predicted membrane-bound spermidine synthase
MGAIIAGIVYLIGAGVVYLLAIDLLNVKLHLRNFVALAIAAIWPALLVLAVIFLSTDAIELAWQRRNRRSGE